MRISLISQIRTTRPRRRQAQTRGQAPTPRQRLSPEGSPIRRRYPLGSRCRGSLRLLSPICILRRAPSLRQVRCCLPRLRACRIPVLTRHLLIVGRSTFTGRSSAFWTATATGGAGILESTAAACAWHAPTQVDNMAKEGFTGQMFFLRRCAEPSGNGDDGDDGEKRHALAGQDHDMRNDLYERLASTRLTRSLEWPRLYFLNCSIFVLANTLWFSGPPTGGRVALRDKSVLSNNTHILDCFPPSQNTEFLAIRCACVVLLRTPGWFSYFLTTGSSLSLLDSPLCDILCRHSDNDRSATLPTGRVSGYLRKVATGC